MLIYLKAQCKIVLKPGFQHMIFGHAIPKNKAQARKVFSTEMALAD
jgi:hypothetical protein